MAISPQRLVAVLGGGVGIAVSRMVEILNSAYSNDTNIVHAYLGDSLGHLTSQQLHKYWLDWMDVDRVTSFSRYINESGNQHLFGGSSGAALFSFLSPFTVKLKTDYDVSWSGTCGQLASGTGVITGNTGSTAITRSRLNDRIQIPFIREPGGGTVQVRFSTDPTNAEATSGHASWLAPTQEQIQSSHTLVGGELVINCDGAFGLEMVDVSFGAPLASRIIQVTHQSGGPVRVLAPFFRADSWPGVQWYQLAEGSNEFANVDSVSHPIMKSLLDKIGAHVITANANDAAASWAELFVGLQTLSDLPSNPVILLIGEGPKEDPASQTNVEAQKVLFESVAPANGWLTYSGLQVETSWAVLDSIGQGGDGLHLDKAFYARVAEAMLPTLGIGTTPVRVADKTIAEAEALAIPEVDDWEARVLANSGTLTAQSRNIALALMTALHQQNLRDRLEYMLPLLGADLAAARVPLIDDFGVGAATAVTYTNAHFTEAGGLLRAASGAAHYLDTKLNTANASGHFRRVDDSLWIRFGAVTTGSPLYLDEGSASKYIWGWTANNVAPNPRRLYAGGKGVTVRWNDNFVYTPGLWTLMRNQFFGVAYYNGVQFGRVLNDYVLPDTYNAKPLLIGSGELTPGVYSMINKEITFFAKGRAVSAAQCVAINQIINDALITPLGR